MKHYNYCRVCAGAGRAGRVGQPAGGGGARRDGRHHQGHPHRAARAPGRRGLRPGCHPLPAGSVYIVKHRLHV